MEIGGEEMGGLEACRRDELTGVGRPAAGERAVDATDGERTKGEEHVGAGEAGRYIILSLCWPPRVRTQCQHHHVAAPHLRPNFLGASAFRMRLGSGRVTES